MEQRSLRLGDIVDDYCPRERRVTNHAVVAIVGNVIRQTRCSTCEAEHEYKEAKIPKKKLKPGAEPSSDLAGGILVTAKPVAMDGEIEGVSIVAEPEADGEVRDGEAVADPAAAAAPAEGQNDQAQESETGVAEGWSTHRPLIRATLPKTDGEPPPVRAIPEFTMHQRHGRGFGGRGFRHGHQANGGPFRGGSGSGNGNEPDGNRAPQPGGRPGGRRRRRRRPR